MVDGTCLPPLDAARVPRPEAARPRERTTRTRCFARSLFRPSLTGPAEVYSLAPGKRLAEQTHQLRVGAAGFEYVNRRRGEVVVSIGWQLLLKSVDESLNCPSLIAPRRFPRSAS